MKETGHTIIRGLWQIDRVVTFANPRGVKLMPINEDRYDPFWELDDDGNVIPKEDS